MTLNLSLRPVRSGDTSALLGLLSLPPVYEFLCDGAPPPREAAEAWVVEALAAEPPLGLWLLEDEAASLLGCVRLSEPEDAAASAELTYVLHPSQWGKGVATAMSRTVLTRAFGEASCSSVLAGTDVPNSRSVAVMQRLGMERFRDVVYPAGAGVEYRISRPAFRTLSAEPTLPVRA
ncbi:MAG: GNAT family N-acetyltransferase [Myxococcota bacterium]